MMTVLLESAVARGPRRTPWAAASITAHTALIAVAIALTTQATGEAVDREPIERPIFIPMPQQPAEPISATGQQPRTPVDPPPSVPITLPSIPTFDPSVPFAPAQLPVQEIFSRPAPLDAVPGSAGPVADGIHTSATVERIASSLAGNGHPVYPRTLQRANVEGEVLVQFVVDAAGRVERGSITIMQATHPLFADAVRDWLPSTRYAPAEIGGTRVRQLVQQTIGFALTR